MSLNALGDEYWETLSIYVVNQRLDGETGRDWQLQTRAKTMKNYADLNTFIEQLAKALEAAPMTPVSVLIRKSSKSQVTQFPSYPSLNDTQRFHRCGDSKSFSIAN